MEGRALRGRLKTFRHNCVWGGWEVIGDGPDTKSMTKMTTLAAMRLIGS